MKFSTYLLCVSGLLIIEPVILFIANVHKVDPCGGAEQGWMPVYGLMFILVVPTILTYFAGSIGREE